MSRPTVGLTLGLVLFATGPIAAAEGVSLDVDLQGAAAAARWVLPPNGGASVAGGELVLDTISHGGIRVFLREPILSDLTLTCKIRFREGIPGEDVSENGWIVHRRYDAGRRGEIQDVSPEAVSRPPLTGFAGYKTNNSAATFIGRGNHLRD